jgi:hypothetical protein
MTIVVVAACGGSSAILIFLAAGTVVSLAAETGIKNTWEQNLLLSYNRHSLTTILQHYAHHKEHQYLSWADSLKVSKVGSVCTVITCM